MTADKLQVKRAKSTKPLFPQAEAVLSFFNPPFFLMFPASLPLSFLPPFLSFLSPSFLFFFVSSFPPYILSFFLPLSFFLSTVLPSVLPFLLPFSFLSSLPPSLQPSSSYFSSLVFFKIPLVSFPSRLLFLFARPEVCWGHSGLLPLVLIQHPVSSSSL